MFEAILIRHRNDASMGKPVDIGTIGEALLFYRDVRVVLNPWMLRSFLASAEPEVVLNLVDDGFLTLSYEANDLVILIDNATNTHKPGYVAAPKLSLQEHLPRVLQDILGKSGKARRLAQRLARKIDVLTHTDSTVEQTRVDLADAEHVRYAIDVIFAEYVPEYTGSRRLKIEFAGDSANVVSEIDFTAANTLYHQRIACTHSSLSPAYLMAHIMSVRADLVLAAHYNAELVADRVNAAIARNAIERSFINHDLSTAQIGLFQQFLFGDARALADALRGGRKLRELLPLIAHAAKFKHWLQQYPPSADLLKEYYKEVTARSWIDHLPGKTVRWMLFAGVGLGIDALGAGGLGAALAAGVSAADTFLTERIAKGWRPNQLIDELEVFIEQSREPGPRY